MTDVIRPCRSVLYMPGSNARALEKAKGLPADALILDLEDAVSPDAKEEARRQVCAAVRGGGYGAREIIIRVNGLDTPWGLDDIRAASDAAPDAILVPKVDTAHGVQQYEALMNDHGAASEIDLWAMMETPRAILGAQGIAASSAEPGSRLKAWVMGTNDLAKELGCAQPQSREPLITSLGLCVLAARAYGLVLIDGVFNEIQDVKGFSQVCSQGRAFGFDGKTLIHPSQIEACNEIFSPSDDEVAWAREVIAAFDHPDNHGKGALKVNGRMVERLHADIARRTVAMAEAIADIAAAIA